MKWFIVNQLEPVAQLYWSDVRGSWSSKSLATAYSVKDSLKEMPLCLRGAIWSRELPEVQLQQFIPQEIAA